MFCEEEEENRFGEMCRPFVKADVGQILLVVSTKLGHLLVLSSCPLQVIVRFLQERKIAPIKKDCGSISRLRRNL